MKNGFILQASMASQQMAPVGIPAKVASGADGSPQVTQGSTGFHQRSVLPSQPAWSPAEEARSQRAGTAPQSTRFIAQEEHSGLSCHWDSGQLEENQLDAGTSSATTHPAPHVRGDGSLVSLLLEQGQHGGAQHRGVCVLSRPYVLLPSWLFRAGPLLPCLPTPVPWI